MHRVAYVAALTPFLLQPAKDALHPPVGKQRQGGVPSVPSWHLGDVVCCCWLTTPAHSKRQSGQGALRRSVYSVMWSEIPRPPPGHGAPTICGAPVVRSEAELIGFSTANATFSPVAVTLCLPEADFPKH